MHSSDIRAKRFSSGPSGIFGITKEKYAAAEVDALLARCAEALEATERGDAPTIDPDEIVVAQFRYTRIGAGYDPDEVDDYLDQVVVTLRASAHDSEAAKAQEHRVTAEADEVSAAMSSADVRGRTFATRGMGAVEIDAVDAFVARCADALAVYEAGGHDASLTAAEVIAARFEPTMIRLGYNSDEVDAFLGDVAVALAHHERLRD
ncbi:DivIVA domain-containing protein [Planococcus sp. APC 4015]|nr:DivIVA domain-containing protein [Planococcus sp. APC 4015]